MNNIDFGSGFTVERRKHPNAGSAFDSRIMVERRKRPFSYRNTDGPANWRGHHDGYVRPTEPHVAAIDTLESKTPSEELFSLFAAFQERERERIAADLHDSIGASLTAVKFRLEESIMQLQTVAPDCTVTRLTGAASELKRTIEEVRRIAMNLRPSMLDDLGIVATISWYCRELESCYQGVRVLKQVSAKEEDIPAALKTTIFRILQEASNNSMKHSGANVLSIKLSRDAQNIRLAVEDNGKGYDPAQVRRPAGSSHGFGSIGMRERIKGSGGSLVIKSGLFAGTQVIAEWPVALF